MFYEAKVPISDRYSRYRNVITPLRTKIIEINKHQHFQMRYVTLFHLKGAQKLSAKVEM